MAVNIISMSAAATVTANTSGDIWIVNPNVFITPTGTPAIDGSGVNGMKTFLIYGHLIGDDADGMLLGDDPTNTGGDNNVHVFAGGSIFGDLSGIRSHGPNLDLTNDGDITAEQDAVFTAELYANILNTGRIAGNAGNGITTGSVADVTNHGNIQADFTGISTGGDSKIINTGTVNSNNGVGISASSLTNITNSGTVSGSSNGISTFGQSSITNTGLVTAHRHFAEAIGIIATGGSSTVTNEGSVIATAYQVGKAVGVRVGGDNVTVNNLGNITSDNTSSTGDAGSGVEFVSATGEKGVLINDGTITSDGFAVKGGAGEETVTNSGHIHGNVDLGGGVDIYDGVGGTLSFGSEIDLGSGDDMAYGGEGRERILDGGGDDIIEANGGRDSIRAGTGRNEYDGGDGRDYLSYYDFNASIRIDLLTNSTAGGTAGNAASNDTIVNIESLGGTNGGGDTLIGSDVMNGLFGWGGNDRLFGRGGDDKLDGGAGDDFFDGGAGSDRLFGGTGNDRFHFDRGEGDDLVMDFENNIDTIEFDNFAGFTTAADALAFATQQGNDVFFDFGGNDGTLMVFGTTIGQLGNDIDIV